MLYTTLDLYNTTLDLPVFEKLTPAAKHIVAVAQLKTYLMDSTLLVKEDLENLHVTFNRDNGYFTYQLRLPSTPHILEQLNSLGLIIENTKRAS